MNWKTILGGALAGGALTQGLSKELMASDQKKDQPGKPGPKPVDIDVPPAYKKGTKRVPKTGIAKLHKGEAVLNKSEAKRYRAGGLALGGKKKVPKTKKAKGKIQKTMHEFKKGTLHSGSKKGPKVTSKKQAIAISLSQARKEG